MPEIQWAVQSYKARALPLSAQRIVNFYAEAAPKDAKSPVVLYGTPGIKSFASTVGTGPIRGLELMDEVLYAVSGCELYSVDSAGKAIALGNICPGQVAGSVPASVSFDITAGTSDPGTNTISSVTINGAELLATGVDWVTGNEATASSFVNQVTGGTPGLASASYDNVSLTGIAEVSSAVGLFFSSDGTKMYLVETFTDFVYQYDLSTPWDLSTATYSGNKGATQVGTPNCLVFNSDGTKMYVNQSVDNNIDQYTLSIAWDVSTASDDLDPFSWTAETDVDATLALNSDGTKMYLVEVGGVGRSVLQYSLSSADDVSTATSDSKSFDFSSEAVPTKVIFNSTGTKMYMVSNSTDIVYQYTLSTPDDVSTAVYDEISFDVSNETTNSLAIFIGNDNTKMYLINGTGDDVFQYSLGGGSSTYTATFFGSIVTITPLLDTGPDSNGFPVIITTTGDVLTDPAETTLTGGYFIEGGLPSVPSDLGCVSMSHNAASTPQLCIVDGSNGWIYTTTGGLQRITDTDFFSADIVDFQDQMFVFNRAGTGQFFLSNLNDGTAYTATDIATAEGDPDNLVALISNRRELWLFGVETIEVWYNSGDPDFTFSRFEGGFIERGCAAALSIAEDDNAIFWLGEDRVFYSANGFTPQRISQHAIEEALRKYKVVSDACAYIYTMAGHKFYVVTFTEEKATWVYDITTGLWHERESFGLGLWRATTYVEVYGKHLVGDSQDGKIGELDLDTYEEYGSTMQGIATGPPVDQDRRRIFHRRFELDIESGVGLTSGQGSDPQVWLDYSDDGGHTFSKRKPFFSIGKKGAYRQRLRWMGLGSSRQRIYQLTVSDPVKRSIVAAHLDAQAGDH